VEGEVYICLDEARRRAEAMEHSVFNELLLYATHGLLHLIGYDDHDAADHRRMHAREDELLTAIGVGAIFEAQREDRL
jgi:probable rRNA maturation factor